MTIRSKFLLFYGVMLTVGLIVAVASIWATFRWRLAAENLTLVRGQEARAEKLRAGLHMQVDLGLDFLAAEQDTTDEFALREALMNGWLDELKLNAVNAEEVEHIEGLEEARDELTWRLNEVFSHVTEATSGEDRWALGLRLREIGEEGADEVAALNRYYRFEVQRNVATAMVAGDVVETVVVVAVVIVLVQLLALIFLVQRWLVQPIASVSEATRAISKGAFDTRVRHFGRDEWGKLAMSINDMARSLDVLQRQVRTQERQSALGEVAAYTAHNIQNPLASIRAAAQVTLDENKSDDPQLASCLSEIIEVVDRLSLWVKRFLSYAKPMTLTREQTDINLIVQQVHRIIAGSGSSTVRVTADLTNPLPMSMVDPLLLEQALAALLTNALEAGADTVSIATTIEGEDDESRWIVVRVRDNGRGVSDRIKKKLFQAFATDKEGGTGLGLAQARRIVDLHGGDLTLESAGDIGTIASIKLPLDESETHSD